MWLNLDELPNSLTVAGSGYGVAMPQGFPPAPGGTGEPASQDPVANPPATQEPATQQPKTPDAETSEQVPAGEAHAATADQAEHSAEHVEDHPAAAEKSLITRAMDHYLDVNHLFDHVRDSDHIELPKFLGGKLYMPNPLGGTKEKPLWGTQTGTPVLVGQFTKFMALELIAAVVLCVAFIAAARRTKHGERPKGRIANMLEAVVVFIRDEIARPAIGSKDAYRFLPFLLTLFFFILILNLFGLFPWLGSVTGSISVTAVLAVLTFLVVVGSGIKKMGVVGFLKAQAPHMDLPPGLGLVLVPMIWLIEVFGLVVKHVVLAIRLFANMFGGHLVLAAVLGFVGIGATVGALAWGISLGGVLFLVLFCLLELLVAFLQAYIFTFLAALFIGFAQHPH
jgi:F-type H+-transporting ATPase subunit a